MRELQAIHADRDQVREAIANAGQGTDVSQWQVEEMRYTDELAEATTYWESQKTLEERVEEEVRDNGYIFDTLKVDGLTMPEIITDDVQYDYARRGVQLYVVGLNTSHSNLISALKSEHWKELQVIVERAAETENKAERLQTDNKDLEVKNYELGLDNDDMSEKVRKGAELLYEATQQIEQQKKHIEDLRAQQTLGIRQALNVVSEPQDTTSFKAEIDASKKRITNVQFKDEHGIDRRTKTAIEVLTGEPIEYQEYVEKRYIILNEVEAEQYRADEANKKAEAELQNTIIPVQELQIDPVNPVLEEEAPAEENSFQEEVAAANDSGLQEDQGNSIMESVVGQESEVDNTPVTKSYLEKRLDEVRNELLEELQTYYSVKLEVA